MVYIVYVVGGWWHCVCDSVVKLIVGTKLRRRDRSLLLLGCLMKRWADTVLQLHHVVGMYTGVLHVVSSYCILDRGLNCGMRVGDSLWRGIDRALLGGGGGN